MSPSPQDPTPSVSLLLCSPLRIKDKNGCVPAEYLNVESCAIDGAIQRSLAIATGELQVGGIDSADIASDDNEPGSGSGSESD